MGAGAGLCMYDVVINCSRSLSHLLMSSCFPFYVIQFVLSRLRTVTRFTLYHIIIISKMDLRCADYKSRHVKLWFDVKLKVIFFKNSVLF